MNKAATIRKLEDNDPQVLKIVMSAILADMILKKNEEVRSQWAVLGGRKSDPPISTVMTCDASIPVNTVLAFAAYCLKSSGGEYDMLLCVLADADGNNVSAWNVEPPIREEEEEVQ
jgi:hypothetical protein